VIYAVQYNGQDPTSGRLAVNNGSLDSLSVVIVVYSMASLSTKERFISQLESKRHGKVLRYDLSKTQETAISRGRLQRSSRFRGACRRRFGNSMLTGLVFGSYALSR
jgi:hypothetical protein